jgi:hypothetical protein
LIKGIRMLISGWKNNLLDDEESKKKSTQGHPRVSRSGVTPRRDKRSQSREEKTRHDAYKWQWWWPRCRQTHVPRGRRKDLRGVGSPRFSRDPTSWELIVTRYPTVDISTRITHPTQEDLVEEAFRAQPCTSGVRETDEAPTMHDESKATFFVR